MGRLFSTTRDDDGYWEDEYMNEWCKKNKGRSHTQPIGDCISRDRSDANRVGS